jgi:hypothetical protein
MWTSYGYDARLGGWLVGDLAQATCLLAQPTCLLALLLASPFPTLLTHHAYYRHHPSAVRLIWREGEV